MMRRARLHRLLGALCCVAIVSTACAPPTIRTLTAKATVSSPTPSGRTAASPSPLSSQGAAESGDGGSSRERLVSETPTKTPRATPTPSPPDTPDPTPTPCPGRATAGALPNGPKFVYMTGNECAYELRLSSTDGTQTRTIADIGVVGYSWAPDGRRLAYWGSDFRSSTPSGVYVLDVETTTVTRITDSDSHASWMPAAWSPDGLWIALNGPILVSADGTDRRTLGDAGGVAPSWSPDGAWIAFGGCVSQADGDRPPGYGSGMCVVRPDGSGRHVVSGSLHAHARSWWSPDSARLLFVAGDDSARGLYSVRPDGSDLLQITRFGPDWVVWSPDGKSIAVSRDRSAVVMNADGTDQRKLLDEAHAVSWSPDGSRIALMRSSGVWMIDPDGTDLTHVIDDPLATAPLFAPKPPAQSSGP